MFHYNVYKLEEVIEHTRTNDFCIGNQDRNLLIWLKLQGTALQSEREFFILILTAVKIF